VRGWAAGGAASLICLAACGLGTPAAPFTGPAGVPGPRTTGGDSATVTPEVGVVEPGSHSRAAGDSGQQSPGPRIARLELDPRGIFEPVPGSRLQRFYRLADRLHVRTRPATIRRHLLLEEGREWSEARAQESERALRALDIFSAVRIEGRPHGDSVVVSVRTRDAWTTSPEVTLESGGGKLYGSAQFSERNLLGMARSVSVGYSEEPTGYSRWIEIGDPALAGTRGRLVASAATGSSGSRNAIVLERPFYSEDTRFAFGLRAERTDGPVRLYDSGAEAARFPRGIEGVEVYAGLGRRRGRVITRVTGSVLAWERRFGTGETVAGSPPEFTGGEERTRLRRVRVEGLLWRPRFIERAFVERLDGIEDIDLGPAIAIACGVSPRALGSDGNEGYAAVRLRAGVEAGSAGFGWFRVTAESRLRAGIREGAGQVEARWVNQGLPRHTLVVAALGAGLTRPARDGQLVLGGLNGLRAHDVYALSGNRLVRVNAESRWLLGREILQLVSLGAAGFWDAGRTLGPGSGGQPWQHDVGLGLRIALPRSALNRVARIDVAWRISPSGPGSGEPVFSFSSSQAF